MARRVTGTNHGFTSGDEIKIGIGRREFGMAGISAAALVAWESSGLAQTKAEHADHHHDVDKCAVACGACQRSCDSCSTHCADLAASGKKEHLESLKTCQDCAAICATASKSFPGEARLPI